MLPRSRLSNRDIIIPVALIMTIMLFKIAPVMILMLRSYILNRYQDRYTKDLLSSLF